MRFHLGIFVILLTLSPAAALDGDYPIKSVVPDTEAPYGTRGFRWSWGKQFHNRVSEDLAPMMLTKKRHAELEGIEGNGFLYLVKIDKSSGDPQFDFDCLQSILGAACFKEDDTGAGQNLKLFTQSFDSDLADVRNGQFDGAAKFLADHPDKKEGYLLFYKIPLDVLNRFPGLFTEKELLDATNIGTIRNEDKSSKRIVTPLALASLAGIYSGKWIAFFVKHPNASKQEILDVASRISNYSQ